MFNEPDRTCSGGSVDFNEFVFGGHHRAFLFDLMTKFREDLQQNFTLCKAKRPLAEYEDGDMTTTGSLNDEENQKT